MQIPGSAAGVVRGLPPRSLRIRGCFLPDVLHHPSIPGRKPPLRRQLFHHRQPLGPPTSTRLHPAKLRVTHNQIPLPARIAWIVPGQALGNGEAGLIAQHRARQIALSDPHIADLLMADGEVALPARIAWIVPGQALGNGVSGLKAQHRARQIALGDPHVADPVMADGEVALGLGIGCVRKAFQYLNGDLKLCFGS